MERESRAFILLLLLVGSPCTIQIVVAEHFFFLGGGGGGGGGAWREREQDIHLHLYNCTFWVLYVHRYSTCTCISTLLLSHGYVRVFILTYAVLSSVRVCRGRLCWWTPGEGSSSFPVQCPGHSLSQQYAGDGRYSTLRHNHLPSFGTHVLPHVVHCMGGSSNQGQ